MPREKPRAAPRAPRRKVDPAAVENLERGVAAAEHGEPANAEEIAEAQINAFIASAEEAEAREARRLASWAGVRAASEAGAKYGAGLARKAWSAPVAPTPVEPPPSTGSGTVERKGRITREGRIKGRVLRRLTVYLPPELATRLDVRSAVESRDRSDLIADAVAAYLERAEEGDA